MLLCDYYFQIFEFTKTCNNRPLYHIAMVPSTFELVGIIVVDRCCVSWSWLERLCSVLSVRRCSNIIDWSRRSICRCNNSKCENTTIDFCSFSHRSFVVGFQAFFRAIEVRTTFAFAAVSLLKLRVFFVFFVLSRLLQLCWRRRRTTNDNNDNNERQQMTTNDRLGRISQESVSQQRTRRWCHTERQRVSAARAIYRIRFSNCLSFFVSFDRYVFLSMHSHSIRLSPNFIHSIPSLHSLFHSRCILASFLTTGGLAELISPLEVTQLRVSLFVVYRVTDWLIDCRRSRTPTATHAHTSQHLVSSSFNTHAWCIYLSLAFAQQIMALLLSAIVHDFDHVGFNNAFLVHRLIDRSWMQNILDQLCKIALFLGQYGWPVSAAA